VFTCTPHRCLHIGGCLTQRKYRRLMLDCSIPDLPRANIIIIAMQNDSSMHHGL
jgi:hypothetical protein